MFTILTNPHFVQHNAAKCSEEVYDLVGRGRMPQNHRISVGLSSAEHDELRQLSEKHRVSVAWLGRQAITEFLERHRNKEFQLPLLETETQGSIQMLSQESEPTDLD